MATHLYKDFSKEHPNSPHVVSASKAMLTTLCGAFVNVNGANGVVVTKDITQVNCTKCAGMYFLDFMGRKPIPK